jgi:nucleoside-diphosphate-sugar epimerase
LRNPIRKRILVTGGAGFFGSLLCERLRPPSAKFMIINGVMRQKPESLVGI